MLGDNHPASGLTPVRFPGGSGRGDEISLWSVPSGEAAGTLIGRKDDAIPFALAPDGQALASTRYEGTLRLWSAATWAEAGRIALDGYVSGNEHGAGLAACPDDRSNVVCQTGCYPRTAKEEEMVAGFRVGIIGCGRPRTQAGATGFGQGHIHAAGYEASSDCEIVAAADIDQGNLDAFRQEHDIPRGYLDYREMLKKEKLDIVSVCTWPHLHAQMVIDAARAGVKAIHAEKPMAPTWGEAKEMAAACEQNGVQLTFNHQRRFGSPFRKAKDLLDSGAIGDLVRVEAFTSNLYDWGTHWFDMMFMYNDEQPVEWVIGQIEARGGRAIFGVQIEGQGMSFFRWKNGVYGLMITGGQEFYEHEGVAKDIMSCGNRLIGLDGTIEVGVHDGPQLRMRSVETGHSWKEIAVPDRIHGGEHVVAAVLDLVDALKTGREPVLSARKALQATELIFATYESSRRRGRVDLPLDVDDSAFLSMLQAGDIAITA